MLSFHLKDNCNLLSALMMSWESTFRNSITCVKKGIATMKSSPQPLEVKSIWKVTEVLLQLMKFCSHLIWHCCELTLPQHFIAPSLSIWICWLFLLACRKQNWNLETAIGWFIKLFCVLNSFCCTSTLLLKFVVVQQLYISSVRKKSVYSRYTVLYNNLLMTGLSGCGVLCLCKYTKLSCIWNIYLFIQNLGLNVQW